MFLSLSSLRLVHSYLSNRKQRKEFSVGVQHGSLFRASYRNILVCDLFTIIDEKGIPNYTDGNTRSQTLANIINSLENAN